MIKLISNKKYFTIIMLALMLNYLISLLSNNILIISLNLLLSMFLSIAIEYKDIIKKIEILKKLEIFKIKKYFIKDILINYFNSIFLFLIWSVVPYIIPNKNILLDNYILLIFYNIVFVLFILIFLIDKINKNIYIVYDKNYVFYKLLTNFIKYNKNNSLNKIKLYLEDKMNDDYYNQEWTIYKENDNVYIFKDKYNNNIKFEIKCEIKKDNDYTIYSTSFLISNKLIKTIEHFIIYD